MGVTNLWQVLSPVQKHNALSTLKGQTLAVDLSIWVCENQCVKQMQGVVTRPYLRNLYFRINCLVQLGINLIFAVEGEAPDLKHETMSRRQEVQYKGKKKGPSKQRKQGRSNFNAKLRECCEMLDCLGVPYIQSSGEAEALCGLLNAAGIVDGCITNDGDVFLYGARTVYRNFTINSKDPHVETYSMIDIEENLDLDRERMVALALLVGCDYLPKGVPGIGIEKATKLLTKYKDISPLQRFKRWRSMADSECFDSVEVQIKRKSSALPEFPQKRIIDEFLIPKDPLPSRKFTWKRPKLVPLQTFSLTKLEWPEEYTQDKVLPLITLWDMTDIIKEGEHKHLIPHRIVKARVRHGIPSLEVEWYKQDDDRVCQSEYYVTIEDKNLFSQCFQQLVEEFDDLTAMKKSKSKGHKKKTKDVAEDNTDIVTEQDQDVDILTDQLDSLHLKPMAKGEIAGTKDHLATGEITNTKNPVALEQRTDINDPMEIVETTYTKCSLEKGEIINTKSSIATGETNDMKYKRLSHHEHYVSLNDTNEFNVSCSEENLSLRSRLLRKGSSSCTFSQNTCIQTDDNESDSPLYSEIRVKYIDDNQNLWSLSPYSKLQKNLKEDISSSYKNFDHDKLTHLSLQTSKEVTVNNIHTNAEGSGVKIYNVSDFSHAGKMDAEINTPNKSRMTTLSPSLYQTLLESTPTSHSKLRKAALLNSILRSPLNVESILNIMSKKSSHFSPIADVNDLKSINESLNNLSQLSMNGIGNFEIESSLLKSIIASGGIVATSPDLEKNKEVSQEMLEKEKNLVELETKSDIMTTKLESNTQVTMTTFDSLASKLSFDVNSPLTSLREKCSSGRQHELMSFDVNSSEKLQGKYSSSLHCISPSSDSSPFYTSKMGKNIIKHEDSVIDLTCDSPTQGYSKQSVLNCCDNSPEVKWCNPQVSSKRGFTTEHSKCTAMVEGKGTCLKSQVREQSITTCNTPHFDCKTTLDLSCHDNIVNKRSGLQLSVDPDELVQATNELIFVNDYCDPGMDVSIVSCASRNRPGCFEVKTGSSNGVVNSISLTKDGENQISLKETYCNSTVVNKELTKLSMDTPNPSVDKSPTFIRGCDMFAWTEEKENETIVSASQDMIGNNMTSEKNLNSASKPVHLKSLVDVTFDDKSPVSLADRLRRKLNVSTMKGILQEVTGNK